MARKLSTILTLFTIASEVLRTAIVELAIVVVRDSRLILILVFIASFRRPSNGVIIKKSMSIETLTATSARASLLEIFTLRLVPFNVLV